MKTKIINFGQNCWQMLTETPGWPDAPKKVRFRRSLPILLPAVLILLLLAWNKTVRDPYVMGERASHQALLEQEKEIESLRLNISEQQAGELSTRTVQVEKEILKDPKELALVLEGMKKQAFEKQWSGNFQASDLSTGGLAPAADQESQLTFVAARAKLAAQPENQEAFSSLLALLDQFSASEKRIDLTRLGIRADEQGRYTAELNFRLVSRASNEKTPQ